MLYVAISSGSIVSYSRLHASLALLARSPPCPLPVPRTRDGARDCSLQTDVWYSIGGVAQANRADSATLARDAPPAHCHVPARHQNAGSGVSFANQALRRAMRGEAHFKRKKGFRAVSERENIV